MKFYITYDQLEDMDACEDELDDFKEQFGSEVEINPSNIRKAAELCMNIGWLFSNILIGYRWGELDAEHSSSRVYAKLREDEIDYDTYSIMALLRNPSNFKAGMYEKFTRGDSYTPEIHEAAGLD